MGKKKPTKITNRKPVPSSQRRPARLKRVMSAAHRQYGGVFGRLARS